MSRFAVVFARIYEVTGNQSFLYTSQKMYDYLWKHGWDSSGACGGGMFFGFGWGENKKITITNGQMMVVGAKLYR